MAVGHMMLEEQKQFLRIQYPKKGLKFCSETLHLPTTTIRAWCSRQKIKQNQNSEFFKDWQRRAALSKIGKKRPAQAEVIKKLWKDGKIKSHPKKSKAQKACIVCGKIFEYPPGQVYASTKKVCSIKCSGELVRRCWKARGHPRGMLGKHHSEEVRQRMSIGHMGQKVTIQQIEKAMKTKLAKYGWVAPPFNRMKASWKCGIAEDLRDGNYYRSSWERNYARYLNFLMKHFGEIKKWEYEPETFWFEKIKRGMRSYKPDFKIFFKDGHIEYHEVKGWMDKRSLTKIKRMRIYHKIEIKIIDKVFFKSIKDVEKLVSPFWE